VRCRSSLGGGILLGRRLEWGAGGLVLTGAKKKMQNCQAGYYGRLLFSQGGKGKERRSAGILLAF